MSLDGVETLPNCLPPSLDLTICRESLVIASGFVEDQNRKVFLIGDLNLRMGSLTGDSVKNSRIQLWNVIEDMGFCWLQPNEDKWTIDTAMGRSIVDYVLRTHKHRNR